MSFIVRGPSSTPSQPTPGTRVHTPQQAGAGADFFGLAGGLPPAPFQDALPAYDFQWLQEETTERTRRFRLTINSWRGGLYPQRGDVQRYSHQMSESQGLVTHHSDLGSLAFKTNSQTLASDTTLGFMYHTQCFGRMIMARYYGQTLFVEDANSTTFTEWNIGPISGISALATIQSQGHEYLAVACIAEGVRLYPSINSAPSLTLSTMTAVFGLQQSLLPGEPVLINAGGTVCLLSPPTFTVLPNNGSFILLPIHGWMAVGPISIGTRPLRHYWVEVNGDHRILSTNGYGSDLQYLDLSLGPTTGVVALPHRRAVAAEDTLRVVVYNGGENDTRIFRDVKAPAGTFPYVAGLWGPDSELFADVNYVPNTMNVHFGTVTSRPDDIQRQIWRYDFETEHWSPVSEITTFASGADFSSYGGTGFGSPLNGHTTAFGGPSLPWSRQTRNLYAPSWQAGNPVYNKFEPPAATVPYSLRDGSYQFAAEGMGRTPSFIFPPGSEYAPKYFTDLHWGGQAGGTGSQVTIRIGEGGTLDDASKKPLHHSYPATVTPGGRHRSFPENDTPIIFPQLEATLTRGSDTTSTPQLFPFTVEGVVVFEERKKRSGGWKFWARR